MNKKNGFYFLSFGIIILSFGYLQSCQSNKLKDYKGTPYSDSQYTAGAQIIPGKLQCEWWQIR